MDRVVSCIVSMGRSTAGWVGVALVAVSGKGHSLHRSHGDGRSSEIAVLAESAGLGI